MTQRKKPTTKPARDGKPLQVYLTDQQWRALERLKKRRSMRTSAELVRYWIDRADYLAKNRDTRKRAARVEPVDPRQMELPAA